MVSLINALNFIPSNMNRYGPKPEPWTILLVIIRKAEIISPNLTARDRPVEKSIINWIADFYIDQLIIELFMTRVLNSFNRIL